MIKKWLIAATKWKIKIVCDLIKEKYATYKKKSIHELMFIMISYFAFQNLDQLYVRLSLTLEALLFPFLPSDSPFNFIHL